MAERQLRLNYSLRPSIKSPAPITLNLYAAEIYSAAVVVQQLVGNLVYYSNHGRYEPRIAESWRRLAPNEWGFKLKTGFICENGEAITASGFKKSLERSILYMSKESPPPIFEKLSGYADFIRERKNLKGIVAEGNELKFRFDSPLRDGLVQVLSFAPYGYICQENLNAQGGWKDDTKFISSGAYRVKELSIGEKYILEKRSEWPLAAKYSPDLVYISHKSPSSDINSPMIIDDTKEAEEVPATYSRYPLVPEYLVPVVLGNFQNGFFSDVGNRVRLRAKLEEVRKDFPEKWKNFIQSSYFYPSQKYEISNDPKQWKDSVPHPDSPLIIQGKEPNSATSGGLKWAILRRALDELGWPYKFAGNDPTWEEISNPDYDIRLLNPSVGGGFEAWSFNYLFCSQLGGNLPDPSKRICRLMAGFDQDKFDEKELAENAFRALSEDSAILPIGHAGLNWFISPGIKMSSLSPLISVIRFDDVELEP